MTEELSLDNILGSDEIENLFSEEEETQKTPQNNDGDNSEENKNDKDNETTEVIDVDNLFTDLPESVGSGKENNTGDREDTYSEKGKDASPNKHFYSSVAKALKEEGIFQTLEDNEVEEISSAEDFAEAVNKQIHSMLDDRQKRIDEALNSGVSISDIQRCEKALEFFNSLQENDIIDESDKGEKLRKQLIYTDFINRGYSTERAQREVQKSFSSGTDIEDAKEALASNKEFFQSEYDNIIREAKEEEQKEVEKRKKQAEDLRRSILEDNKIFGDLQVDKVTRRKIYDNISKPVYKDPETGELFTAIQKYEMENRPEFLKNIGVLFTLTDGFKNLDNLVKNKVRKEVKKGLRELEHTLNNTSRTSDGNLKFVSGVEDDPESFIGKGWEIDV
mgnify:FL=1|jgi:hypothetical protein|nr:MAG TPA: hypothetical protein [Caudoviricetes sp.]